jgi:preprotein translocase subunit SecA
MAQKDPLVEYQREGYDLFVGMMDAIKEESVGFLFNVDVTVEHVADTDGDGETDEVQLFAKGLQHAREAELQYSAPTESGEASQTVSTGKHRGGSEFDNVGRNDECPCGSGKKFKRCHGDPAHAG